MFGRRRINVELGDVFVETLPGRKSIFRSMGLGDASDGDNFSSQWTVAAFLQFNDLPHAKLIHNDTGQYRVIACDALERQDIYKKRS